MKIHVAGELTDEGQGYCKASIFFSSFTTIMIVRSYKATCKEADIKYESSLGNHINKHGI